MSQVAGGCLLFLELDEIARLHLSRAVTLYRRRLRADGLHLPGSLEEFTERICDNRRLETTSLAPGCDGGDPQLDMGPQLYDYEETAARLRLSVRQVQRLVAEGRLPAVRIGTATRVRPDDLRQFVTNLEPGKVA